MKQNWVNYGRCLAFSLLLSVCKVHIAKSFICILSIYWYIELKNNHLPQREPLTIEMGPSFSAAVYRVHFCLYTESRYHIYNCVHTHFVILLLDVWFYGV